MAEYTAVQAQTVAANGAVNFSEAPSPCGKGYICHREGSGLFTLRGITNQCRARYRATFGANIAIPAGGTVEAISIALALDGEPLGSATAIVTPAAVDNFFNVFAILEANVPKGCCMSLSVRNTSTQPITVQNANLVIDRTA